MNPYLQLAVAILSLYEQIATGGAQAEANRLLSIAISLGIAAPVAQAAVPSVAVSTTASTTAAPTTAA